MNIELTEYSQQWIESDFSEFVPYNYRKGLNLFLGMFAPPKKVIFQFDYATYRVFQTPKSSSSKFGYLLRPNWNMIFRKVIRNRFGKAETRTLPSWDDCLKICKTFEESRLKHLRKYLFQRSQRPINVKIAQYKKAMKPSKSKNKKFVEQDQPMVFNEPVIFTGIEIGSNCPHCGAEGKYIYQFTVGTRKMEAMAGCYKKIVASQSNSILNSLVENTFKKKMTDKSLNGWDRKIIDMMKAYEKGILNKDGMTKELTKIHEEQIAWKSKKRY